jgi:type II secretory pathway predicted ATPase ExeA
MAPKRFLGMVFSDSFIGSVDDHTKGLARRINSLCRSALLLGASEGRQVLDEADLKRVTLDLEGPSS